MATIEERLIAIIAPVVSGRAFPNRAQQNVLRPYITIDRIHAAPLNTFAGPSLNNEHWNISVWDLDRLSTYTLAASTRAAMLASNTVGNPVLLTELDAYEDDPKLYRVVQMWSVWAYP